MKKQTYNLVHTYVGGNSFPNIFGGHTPSLYGSIIHVEHMDAYRQQRWPWLKGKWELSDQRGALGWFNTLKEAKEAATERWPGCTFKTRKQFAKEPINFGS